jgi:hypothetical protein
MAENFMLSPKDLLLWQQRAPCASYWFGVRNTHPFINGGQLIPGLGATLPPPPYTLPQLPAYLANSQLIPGIPIATHPGATAMFPPINSVPIYDGRHQNNIAPAVAAKTCPSLPLRKFKFQ